MKNVKLAPSTEALVKYTIFKEKKDELENFINKEVEIWGHYQKIPDQIKTIIDHEFVVLGKYGKRINVNDIEKKISLGEI